MRLSIGLHHGSFSGTNHRNECPYNPLGWCGDLGIETTAALGGFCDFSYCAANIIGTLLAGWAGRDLGKNGFYLGYMPVDRFLNCMVHIDSNYCRLCSNLLLLYGFLVVSNGSSDEWSGSSYLYGVRYMATLYGIVFFSHQLGSFVGVYLGGVLYDMYGSCNCLVDWNCRRGFSHL